MVNKLCFLKKLCGKCPKSFDTSLLYKKCQRNLVKKHITQFEYQIRGSPN